ncbi:hypothetical protein CEQ90_12590 [Lewinellaceae bacterium SD302]|nr:hypothetical protein CEQ90_12590 [Lewinellaceae bacterium SD302]
MPYLILAFTFLLTLLTQCQTAPANPAETEYEAQIDQRPSQRRAAISAAWERKNWLLVNTCEHNREARALDVILKRIVADSSHGRRLRIVRLSELSKTDLGSNSLLMVGNKLPTAVLNGFGATGPEDVRGYDLSMPDWSLRAYYLQNPWSVADSTAAMHLHYASDIERLSNQLEDLYQSDNSWRSLFRGRYGYAITEGNAARVRGFFSDDDWRPDEEEELTFHPPQGPTYEDQQVRLFAPEGGPTKQTVDQFAAQVGSIKSKIARWYKLDSLPIVDIHLYPTLERLSLRFQRMNEVQFDQEDHDLHVSLPIIDNDRELFFCMLRWARQIGSLPTVEAYLDRGLATLASGQLLITKKGIAELESQGLFPSLAELKTIDRESFGDYLYDYAAAVRTYEHFADFGLGLTHSSGERGADRFSLAVHNGFEKGMTFAHEGYCIYNGYGGGTVDASLDSLATLGVNSIAVVPYTFQRDPNVTGEMPVAGSAGSENNAATRSSIRRAHLRGWSVMLKPQIWVGRDSWPGDIDFTTEAEWKQWFKRYSEWMLNYALLAQTERSESLCIGTELRFATLKQPEKWRNLIRAIRSVYDGKITYAANWGEEFDNIGFWDDLDIIGLNSYYPLSEKADATDEELLAGARSWVSMANKVAVRESKPWWLTEVGYRSVEQAWVNPHADAGERARSEIAQARSYEALLTSLDEASEFKGMYVWKWPSYLGRGERRKEKIGFTPGGKAAGELLKVFYESREEG